MNTVSERAQEPRTQIVAMAALLVAVLALTFALTHPAAGVGPLQALGAGYGLTVAIAVAWQRVDPWAVALSSVRITAVILASLALAVRRHRRREGWA
ncbi:hypothetical protein [Kitasatospora sp. HPMI-4]|uniref:hypothetical protein n=1 Tax=Kitasatospora sp. HPMI-4 TaxID=3448443 RepID=UPI003F1CCBBD